MPSQGSASLLLPRDDLAAAGGSSERTNLLLAEARHRTKNLLAVARVLVRRTRVTGRSAEEFRDAVLGRLAVLAQAQEIEQGEATLQALVRRSLAPFLPQVRLAPSPEVRLSTDQVLPLGLLLHELSTNAAKHGSLSAPGGAVSVRWSVSGAGQAPLLVLDWTEEGGPTVRPPEAPGFGTHLIDACIRDDLRGRLQRRYEPDGLQVRIEGPMP